MEKHENFDTMTTTKKRRQMEAKKAALRAENMEKGVYVIAASLPRQKPQLVYEAI